MRSYSNKKVFIAGGSQGIGRAAAVELARRGADVVICARRQEILDEAVESIRSAGAETGTYEGISADITKPEQMRDAAAKAVGLLGRIDLLIVNAGFARCAEINEADMDHFRDLMEVNYFGHVTATKAFLPYFIEQKSGEIVLVASMLAMFSVYGYGAYSASKFALRGLAEALRQEMLAHAVRVKLFLPPTTDTPGLATENVDKPPVVHELEMNSSVNFVHSAEKVAKRMLSWIERDEFLGYATMDSAFQYFVAQFHPRFSLQLWDDEVQGALDRLGEKAES